MPKSKNPIVKMTQTNIVTLVLTYQRRRNVDDCIAALPQFSAETIRKKLIELKFISVNPQQALIDRLAEMEARIKVIETLIAKPAVPSTNGKVHTPPRKKTRA